MTAVPPPLDVDGLLRDRRTRIIVCCGSGGVGKTTTAAALGLRRMVVVHAAGATLTCPIERGEDVRRVSDAARARSSP